MAGLRVIGGIAKGRRLRMVPGEGTRPIGDRAKESLFNIIGADVEGSRFLDLFAGTGSVGIEALSRGAATAVFLDTAPAAIRTVKDNLAATGLTDKANVLQMDAFVFLGRPPGPPFDYVFVAPPQYHEVWLRALRALDAWPDGLSEDAWVVVQIDRREAEDEGLLRLSRFDERVYGTTMLRFYCAN